MAQMWDSGQEEEEAQPHRGNNHSGLQKSYHMNLADQMDAQANGSAWPEFMKSKLGAGIAVVVVLILMTLMVMYGAILR